MSLSMRVKHSFGFLAIAFVLFAPMFRSQARHLSLPTFVESKEGIPLPARGKSTVQELTAGEANTYLIALSKGQFVSAVIERRDLDVSVALYDPAGGVLLQVDCRQSRLTP